MPKGARINSTQPYTTISPRRALHQQTNGADIAADLASFRGHKVRRAAINLSSTNPRDYCVNGLPLNDARSRNVTFGGEKSREDRIDGPWYCQWQSRTDGSAAAASWNNPKPLLYPRSANGSCSQTEPVKVGNPFSGLIHGFGDCLYIDSYNNFPRLSIPQFRNLSGEVVKLGAATVAPVVAASITSSAAAITATAVTATLAPVATISSVGVVAAAAGSVAVVAGAAYAGYKLADWLAE